MQDFVFNTTRSIISETGATSRVGEICKELGINRVLIVTDQGVLKLGLLSEAERSLKKAGLEFAVYADVVADPPEKVVFAGLKQARDLQADGIIGFGGGSSMDTAKLIAFLAVSEQKLEDIYGVGLAKGARLPLIQVPTTAGTGSEVTPISIVTTGETTKKGVVSPVLLPDIALLDAELTLGLPPHITAATGVDAMVHAIEAYATKLKKNPVSDALAREALRLLAGNIETAVHEGKNKEARAKMLLGSMLAGQAFANAPCAAVHALAYPLGGHYHIPHGLSNSLVLPHVLCFNAELQEANAIYSEIAPIIFPSIGEASPADMTRAMIENFEKLIPSLGLQTTLQEMGIKEDALPMLAKDSMLQERLLVNNPREVTESDALEIYTKAFAPVATAG